MDAYVAAGRWVAFRTWCFAVGPATALLVSAAAAQVPAATRPASQPASRPWVSLADALAKARTWVEHPEVETQVGDFEPAVSMIRLRYVRPRPQSLIVLRLDTSVRGVRFFVTEPRPSFGPDGESFETLCETTLAFAERVGADLAVNTSAFGPLRPQPGQGMRIAGLAAYHGAVYSQPEKNFGALYLSQEGRIALRGPPLPTEGVWDVIAGFRMLIDDNALVVTEEELNTSFGGPNPRTAVGVDRAGTILWIVVADGRQPGSAEGLTLVELACAFESLGAWDALNLDGGGSTTLVGRNADGRHRVLNSPIHGGKPGGLRQVGANLGIFLPGRRGSRGE